MQTPNQTTFVQRLLTREPAPLWSPLTALLLLVGYIVIWILSLTMVSVVKGEINGFISPESYVLAALISGLVTTVVVYSWARQQSGDWVANLRLDEVRPQQFLLALLSGLAAAATIDLIGVLLAQKQGNVVPPLFFPLMGDINLTWILAAVTVMLIQPLAETLVFMGVLFPIAALRLKDNFRGIIGTAVLFMAVNIFLAPQQAQWFTITQPLLMGIFVAGTRAVTHSTRMALVARIGFGLFILLAALFGRSFAG